MILSSSAPLRSMAGWITAGTADDTAPTT
jgi:hypothetical protein